MTEIETLQARIAELEAALRWYADKANYHTYGKDICDKETLVELDEGERARAALSSPPPVAVWPRVMLSNYGYARVYAGEGASGDAYSADGMLWGVSLHTIQRRLELGDRELHGSEKAAMLNRLGLDENGKAKETDGVK